MRSKAFLLMPSPEFILFEICMKPDSLNAFFVGLQFLTRISVVKQTVWTEKSFGESVKFFPAIGAVLGIFYAIIAFFIPDKFVMLKSSTVLISMAVLTGSIQYDGFMDTIDGLFSGRSREKMLEIMKDSRVGAFGLVGFVMISIFNFALLVEILQSSTWTFLAAIYAAPIIGRLMMVITIGAFPYARPEGMGKAFAEYTTKSTILFALFETLILLLPLLSLTTDFVKPISGALVLTVAFTVYFGNFAVRKIGGVTGDIYGAATTFAESIVFLSFLIF